MRLIPVDMHPFVVSPRACTWKPCSPGFRPERFAFTVVGPERKTTKPSSQ